MDIRFVAYGLSISIGGSRVAIHSTRRSQSSRCSSPRVAAVAKHRWIIEILSTLHVLLLLLLLLKFDDDDGFMALCWCKPAGLCLMWDQSSQLRRRWWRGYGVVQALQLSAAVVGCANIITDKVFNVYLRHERSDREAAADAYNGHFFARCKF